MAAIKKQNPQLVSESELDQLHTQADAARALVDAGRFAVNQALGQLQNAQQALDKTTIVAPMTGRVTRLNVEQGETAIATTQRDTEVLRVQHGMFGVKGSGDTSGYGGLSRVIDFPSAGQPLHELGALQVVCGSRTGCAYSLAAVCLEEKQV